MLKHTVAALALMISAVSASAQSGGDQLLQNVSRELPRYFRDVDATTLSQSQLAALSLIMHSSRTEGDKRALMRSVIGGPNTLRGLFGKQ